MISIKNIQKFDCDVLIAGGGPAGSGLAYHLAKRGYKVWVAEAERFPRDKVCGDGVSPIALAELHNMGITGFEKFAEANEISKVGLFIKTDKVFIDLSKPEHLPHHARIIPRIELDNWIYQAAQKAGAYYLQDTRVINYTSSCTGVTIILKRGNENLHVRAKTIVGADGSSSTIARILHGSKPKEDFQLLGLRAYYEGVNGPRDRVDIYFSGESFPGIFWMFPKGESGANIGMAMVSTTTPQRDIHVKTYLNNHIKDNDAIKERIGNGKIDGKISGWPLSFFNKQSEITANRVLLAGDAAGLINPLSGDGIQYALLSARWAADTLASCIDQDDFSAAAIYAYRKKIDKELDYDFALSNLLIQFARNKALTPLWMEILTVMIERAKVDKEYADIIAGIFEGTYPSHKALNIPFILKSIVQGGIYLGTESMRQLAQGPAAWMEKGGQLTSIGSGIIDQVKANPNEQKKWLMGLAKNGISVAKHVLQQLTKAGS
jgi:geranylgeranyl reductase family protein